MEDMDDRKEGTLLLDYDDMKVYGCNDEMLKTCNAFMEKIKDVIENKL